METKRKHSGINVSPTPQRTPMQELEAAMEECGFGRFQLRLLFTSLVSQISNVLVSGNTSYLLPFAECDLAMTIFQKGILIAMPYIGMLASGFFAGFVTDTFGRRRFLIWGYLGILLCNIAQGCSQHFETLLAAKFIEGFIFSAAFNALIALVSELTHKKIRDRMMLCSSSCISLAQIVIALMSWSILPQPWRFSFANGAFVISSWNIYLYVCGLWSLTACILNIFLPESPKFLVAHGRYKEALQIVKQIYTENTGKSADNLRVSSFDNSEKPSTTSLISMNKGTFIKRIVTGLIDIKPLFRKPLIVYLVLICSMQVMTMLAYNVLRLWYPQLSTIIEHFSKQHKTSGDLCVMLDSYMDETSNLEQNVTSLQECVPYLSGNETYINSIVMGCVCIIPFVIGGALINRVGKKLLLLVATSICCACVTGITWSSSSFEVVALVSTTVALTQISTSLMQTFTVELFPTVTKTLAISLMMMGGRIGTLVGNILFPVLLSHGCVVPFFTIAGLLFCVAMLSFLLPSPVKK